MNRISNKDNPQACRREKLILNNYQKQQRNLIDPVLVETYGIENKQIANLIASFLPVIPACHTLSNPSGRPLTCFAISADSQYLAAVYEDANSPVLKLWNVATGECQQTTPLPPIYHSVTKFCQLSPDNQRLLTVRLLHDFRTNPYYSICIWNTFTLECLERNTHADTVLQSEFLSAEKVVILWNTGGGRKIDIWDIPTANYRTIANPKELITEFYITNHGQSIVYLMEGQCYRVNAADGCIMKPYEVIVCDINTGNVLHSLTSDRLTLGSQKKLNATADRVILRVFNSPLNETTVENWNPATGASLTKHTYDPAYAALLNTRTPIQLTTDGERALVFDLFWTQGAAFSVRLEELCSGDELLCFPPDGENDMKVINCFAMPPGEHFVVTGNTMGVLNIWDPATGLLVGEISDEIE